MSKYRNKPLVTEDGRFDSQKEFMRWTELKFLQKVGDVKNLKRQMSYELMVNGVKICRYIADFVYDEDGKEIVEDVKSAATAKFPAYRLKKKLMFALFGIEIRET